MKRICAYFVAAATPFSSLLASECDCTVQQGSCTASVTVSPTGASKGLYGADLHFSTSASHCAKVEYYVDNTPFFTVLPHGSGEDRVQGTSEEPVTTQRISLFKCVICRSNRNESAAQKSAAEDIFGNALDSDEEFDSTYTSQRLDEIQANESMPSMETIMGVAAGARMINNAIELENARNQALENEKSNANESNTNSAGRSNSNANNGGATPNQRSDPNQGCKYYGAESWRCGVQ